MAAPRRFRLVFDVHGFERPTRRDGAVERPQPPLLTGEVRLDVDDVSRFHVRLTEATPDEFEQTLDELEQTTRRLNLNVGVAGSDDEDLGDGA